MKFTSYASGSTGNLYTLEDGKTRLIIEAGLPYKEMQRLLPEYPTSYDACLISHSHKDHAHSAKELLSRAVPVYCSSDTAKELGIWSDHFYSPLYPEVETNIGSIEVKPFLGQHLKSLEGEERMKASVFSLTLGLAPRSASGVADLRHW